MGIRFQGTGIVLFPFYIVQSTLTGKGEADRRVRK